MHDLPYYEAVKEGEDKSCQNDGDSRIFKTEVVAQSEWEMDLHGVLNKDLYGRVWHVVMCYEYINGASCYRRSFGGPIVVNC